jgi:hypothetical protein
MKELLMRHIPAAAGMVLAASLLTLAAPAATFPQAPAKRSGGAIDVNAIGPKVGDRVDPFSLKDQTGKVWTLDSIMGPNGAMLVFFRSADW